MRVLLVNNEYAVANADIFLIDSVYHLRGHRDLRLLPSSSPGSLLLVGGGNQKDMLRQVVKRQAFARCALYWLD